MIPLSAKIPSQRLRPSQLVLHRLTKYSAVAETAPVDEDRA